MDPMQEIFCEESSELIVEMTGIIENNRIENRYDQEFVQELFRCVHTMKADATMMLYDGIASYSKKLERLLFCYRNSSDERITDTGSFDIIVDKYLKYVEESVKSISQCYSVKEPLAKDIDELDTYVKELENFGISSVEHVPKKEEKPKRQVYYISSATAEVEIRPKDDTEDSSDRDESGVVLVKYRELLRLKSALTLYQQILDKYDKKKNPYAQGEMTSEDFAALVSVRDSMLHVWNNCTKGDFVPVAKKMELLVDEMSEKLHKNVRLVVSGENTMVEKSKRDKISGALTHMIRNAVDHGIEDAEERERLGKSPIGLVRLTFESKDNHIVVTVEDDGCGIDREKVLDVAERKNMLSRSVDEYSDEDVIQLLLKSGMSTTETPNNYSGRGVGMDVINHNIKQLGGELKITYEEGYGTKLSMVI